jgi:hypothetical protein
MGKINIVTPNTNISAGSVSTGFIKDDAVTLAKIEASDLAVTIQDDSGQEQVTQILMPAPPGAWGTTPLTLKYGKITTYQIEDDAITRPNIDNYAVNGDKIASNSIDSNHYVDGSIDGVHINADVFTGPYVNQSNIDAGNNASYVNGDILQGKTGVSGGWSWVHPEDLFEDIDVKMTGSPTSIVDPVLNIVTGNSGEKPQLMATDPTDDVWSQVGRVGDTYIGGPLDKAYQWGITLDPNNTKGRTGITDTGTGTTHAGDYAVKFQKNYSNLASPVIDMKVYGANGGFNIVAMDDYNGGLPAWSIDGTAYGGYGYKPITLKGSQVSLNYSPTGASTVERLSADNYGTHCSGPVVFGEYRGSSSGQLYYSGASTGDPEILFSLWNVDDSHQTNIFIANEDKLEIKNPLQLASYTTTERDALSVSNGTTIYNETTDKFQGYAGGSWVDLN